MDDQPNHEQQGDQNATEPHGYDIPGDYLLGQEPKGTDQLDGTADGQSDRWAGTRRTRRIVGATAAATLVAIAGFSAVALAERAEDRDNERVEASTPGIDADANGDNFSTSHSDHSNSVDAGRDERQHGDGELPDDGHQNDGRGRGDHHHDGGEFAGGGTTRHGDTTASGATPTSPGQRPDSTSQGS